MSFGNLLNHTYWFGAPLTPTSLALLIMGIVCGLFIILAIVSTVLMTIARDGISRGVWRRFAAWSWTMGLLGWFLFFARYERIIVFNRRYWWIVWLIPSVWWLWVVLRHARKRAPALSQEAREIAFRERYLPKSKK